MFMKASNLLPKAIGSNQPGNLFLQGGVCYSWPHPLFQIIQAGLDRGNIFKQWEKD